MTKAFPIVGEVWERRVDGDLVRVVDVIHSPRFRVAYEHIDRRPGQRHRSHVRFSTFRGDYKYRPDAS